ncbi:MAG: ABC transporter permease [Verrucomicrobia bacterium]|nr:ABC transporter permease [Verrucomicrobiota bacterium]
MKLGKNLSLSIEILGAHKLRTFLSVIGIVVGVAAVVLMVAAGRGAEENILNRIRSMGVNLIAVNAGQTRIIAGRQRQLSTVKTLVPEDAAAILADCPAVALAAPVQSKKSTLRWEDQTANTTVLGMAPAGFLIRNITVKKGRTFAEEEERALLRVAVIGTTVATNLFGGGDAVGQQIRIGRVPFEVIGLMAPKGLDAEGVDQDDVIVIPLRTAMRRVLNVTYLQSIYVQAQDSGSLERAEKEIRSVLRERHRLGAKPDDFTIQNQATLLATERGTSRSLTALIGSVAGISLFVGGVGILAVMLISVRERTAEIGLRRALGATRQGIRVQFLLEAVLLAGAGGGLGVLLGAGSAWALSAFTAWATLISWPSAFIALMFAGALGVFFGIYPASRAASLEPIQALRAE